MACLTGVAGVPGPGYFTDSNGAPKLWVAAETWGLPTNAGAWNGTGGGTWQQDYDNYFSARAAQGVTVLMTDPFGNTTDGGTYNNGNTWDNLPPFNTGTDPTSGLYAPFWARIDYMMNSAFNNGITIGFCPVNEYDQTPGTVFTGWSSAQWTAWGTAIGTRYAAQPNLIWLFGNDSWPTAFDTEWNEVLSGIRGAGDTHLVIAWWEPEYDSRYYPYTSTAAAWGIANSAANFCYTYNCGYAVLEYAYGEVINEGQANLLPTFWGDGYFNNEAAGAGYYDLDDRANRQEAWWMLTDGARGILAEADNIWQWQAGSPAAVTTDWYFVNNLPHIVSAFTALSGWQNLIPDLSSQLVTGGRGTKAALIVSGGVQYEPAFTNNWVTASITPDGTLAICYLPNTTTITIDQSKLPSGYQAKWMDPVTGATQAATKGSSYNSATPGNNSAGDPDWVLVLATPPYATWTVP